MPERSELEATIGRLESRLERVEQRLARLESVSPAPGSIVEPTHAEPEEAALRGPLSEGEALPIIGRALLVLGGAFVLRALTESGLLPQGAGIALGLAYAALWFILADRAGGGTRRRTATLRGLAASIIGFPLLWEATVKFGVLSPPASALALLALTALALSVAARRQLLALAWVVTLGAVATALVLAVATKMMVGFVSVLLLLGLATVWLAGIRRWHGIAWVVAIAADLLVLLMTAMALLGDSDRVSQLFSPGGLVSLQLALPVIYVGSFICRTLAHRRDVSIDETLQGVVASLIGFGGAIALTRSTAITSVPLGIVSLVMVAGCYGVSFAYVDRRLGLKRGFVLYSSLALLFTLVASIVLFRGVVLALTLCAVGLVVASVGSWRSRATLSLHGAVYLIAAAVSSGLVAASVNLMVRPSDSLAGTIGPVMLAVLVAAAIYVWLPVAAHGRTWGRYSTLPKVVVLVVLVLGIGGAITGWVAPALPRLPGGAIDAAALGVLRTAILAVAAVAARRAGRLRGLAEVGWLVYPVLIAGGLKLLLEDLRTGRPATLVVSLVLYGGALILVPRMRSR